MMYDEMTSRVSLYSDITLSIHLQSVGLSSRRWLRGINTLPCTILQSLGLYSENRRFITVYVVKGCIFENSNVIFIGQI